MQVSNQTLELIKSFEGCKLYAYLDVAGIPTIGWGTTEYPDGRHVDMSDTCTQEQADEWLENFTQGIADEIKPFIKVDLNENQESAILSFTYNLGTGAFKGSTLLKVINSNPNSPSITGQFMRWNKAKVNGVLQVVSDLTTRRSKEAKLYSTPVTNS